MPETSRIGREDAIRIWRAGVSAVDPFLLIQNSMSFVQRGDVSELRIGHYVETLTPKTRVIVIGMGKASAKMSKAVEFVLKPLIAARRLSGWVNVPDDMAEPLSSIHLHGARPPQYNEPTEQGMIGSQKIIELVRQATPDDIILCLISGGGSALLPSPVKEVSLEEILAITRFLSSAGANIEELNTVRKEVSMLKGGGLRRLCSGRRLYSLVLSDVLGDRADVIASGTTVRNSTNAVDALNVLKKFHAERVPELAGLCSYIRRKAEAPRIQPDLCDDTNHHYHVIGNIQTAASAAAAKACELGYNPLVHWSDASEDTAEEVGTRIVKEGMNLFAIKPTTGSSFLFDREGQFGPYDCVISGGEPVVRLVPKEKRGLGGRNQQLALAALIWVVDKLRTEEEIPVFLSGGTDGEDGPTDAAGAFFDREIVNRARELMANDGPATLEEHRRRNDAWPLFKKLEGLFITGGTGTNVCDLRVMISPFRQ